MYMDKQISFPIVIMKEGKWFVASCPPLDIATQGKTEAEAKDNMQELIQEFLEDKDTIKPSHSVELASLSFIHARVSTDDKHGKTKTATN